MVALAGKTDFAADPTCCAVVPRDKNEEASRKGKPTPPKGTLVNFKQGDELLKTTDQAKVYLLN